MGEAISMLRLVEAVGGLSATVLLVIAIWYLFTGRVPTPREYHRAMEEIERERERAERKAQEAQEAHDRLKLLSEALPKMAELMDSIDRRLDMHGFPERDRERWRWPWDRGLS